MAVTFTKQPAYVTPSDNPVEFVFKQPLLVGGAPKYNISFVVEVFLSGGSIGKFEVYSEAQDSTYVYGKVDVSNIASPFVPTQNLKPSTAVTVYNPIGYSFIYITVSEKYSTVIDATPTIVSTATSEDIALFKAKLSRSEFLNWDYTKYQKAVNKQLLTDRSYRLVSGVINVYTDTIKKEDSYSFSWFDNTYGQTKIDYKVIYVYSDSSNATITTYEETNLTGNQGLIGAIYFNLANHVSLGYLTSGQASNCVKVLIGISNTSGVSILPLTVLNFDDTCFFNGATLKFMNKYGAYDSYLFTYNKRYSASVKAFEFERSQGVWNGTTYSQSNTNTGRLTYLKQTTKKLELSSDWLDETKQNWLTQMYDSPVVYINEGEENESVTITNSSYQIKQDKHDELFNEIVEIEFTPENSIRI